MSPTHAALVGGLCLASTYLALEAPAHAAPPLLAKQNARSMAVSALVGTAKTMPVMKRLPYYRAAVRIMRGKGVEVKKHCGKASFVLVDRGGAATMRVRVSWYPSLMNNRAYSGRSGLRDMVLDSDLITSWTDKIGTTGVKARSFRWRVPSGSGKLLVFVDNFSKPWSNWVGHDSPNL